jgi:hypothetical protein
MNVSYIEPLKRAWARSRRLLLQPFALRTWLVLGFAAFLSEALVTGNGVRHSYRDEDAGIHSEAIHALEGFLAPALMTAIGIVIVAAILILGIILLWVNSRGRFVFLDGVARQRAAIVEPWKRFGRQGNSLFVWMIFFFLVCAAIGTVMILPFLASLAALWANRDFHWGLLGALWMLLVFAIPFVVVAAYTLLFLSDFVVPIMYRYGLGAQDAWRRFLPLLRAHPAYFLVYGVFVLTLWVVVGFVMTLVGFSTCCIGFILFGLPYVSSLVTLPVLVTFRGLGPEFLAQFEPELSVFGAETAAPAPPPAAGGGAPPEPPRGA